MAFGIALTLALLALLFVLYPLLRRAGAGKTVEPAPDQPATAAAQPVTDPDPDLAEREQTARMAIQEVELDYQLGNIAEPEYRQLRERYMRRALVALKARYEREQELDDEIEEQLRHLKESHAKTDL